MTHYCPIHERGWYAGGDYEPPQWIPLAAWKLRLALSIAQASDCAETITIIETRCDVCSAQEGRDNGL